MMGKTHVKVFEQWVINTRMLLEIGIDVSMLQEGIVEIKRTMK